MIDRLPVTNERGEQLLAIHRWSPGTGEVPAADVALVIALRDEGVLLVRNRRRQVWELPGGWVDAGETAADCAAREFAEETGMSTRDLACRAIFELARAPDDATADRRTLLGALFVATVGSGDDRLPDDEIDAVRRWPLEDLPADLSAIDRALIDLHVHRPG